MAKNGVKKWLKKESLRQITQWARDDSLNISDIAEKMEISSATFRRWRNDYPEIAQAFDEGRRVVDEKVENSFIKMCTGYHEKVLKKQKVKRKEYDDRGKVTAEYEEFVDVEEEEYIPPSVVAQKFYLLNRMPDRYIPENAVLPPGNEDEEESGVVMLPGVGDEEVQEAEIID